MNYLSQILFSFGVIGFINSLMVSGYFLISKSYNTRSNRFFGFFLTVLILRVLNSVFYAFSTEEPVWFLQFGPTFFLLIGPLLFNYTLSLLKPESFWIKHWKHHVLLWCFIVVVLMILVPFKENIQLNKKTILPIINFQWLIYILLSIAVVIRSIYHKGNIVHNKWFTVFTFINLIIWASFALIDFDYFISGSIIFSIFFYILFIFFLFNKKITNEIFVKNKVKRIASNSSKSNRLKEKLNKIMLTEKLYTNPNLKIADVAVKLELTSHELSKLLNDSIGKSFTDFINEYRIEEAKQLISIKTQYTIEAIGKTSGFNSKSAFYKAFKKYTRTTPSQYKKLL